MTRRIGFTGDVMLGRLVDDRQRSRPVDAVWGTVSDRLRRLDALVINLECVLSARGRQWRRTHRPFHFRADPDWAVPALERAGVDVCALANNHVLDYEAVALRDTLEHLNEAGIAHTGAGETIDEALEPAVLTVGEDDRGPGGGGEDGTDRPLEVAVVSFTDNTPEYAADEVSSGTAWIDLDDPRRASSGRRRSDDVDDSRTKRRVREALERARESDPDLLIASLHWGPNMVTEPPDSFREFGRWLIDEGADLIHGHSAHVFQGVEVHDGCPIVYDAGDFVDDYAVDAELHNDRSFLFVLSVAPEKRGDGTTWRPTELRLEPIEIDDCAVHEASSDAADWSRDRMRELSSPFGTAFERDGEALVLSLDA